MPNTISNLPQFFRLPSADVPNLPISPGSFIFSPDTQTVYLDGDTERMPLSPVRSLLNPDNLEEQPTAFIQVDANGVMYVYAHGVWYEYAPNNEGEATYEYRFEVVDRVSEVRFSSDVLGVTHFPEFDLLDEDKNNISGSDWLTRGWDGSDYVLTCAGGWTAGVYYLKLSYNVKYDAAGVYIKDDTATAADIELSAGEHYIFVRRLTALSLSFNDSKGTSSVRFTTADTFTYQADNTVSYVNGYPNFQPNTEYLMVLYNNLIDVKQVGVASAAGTACAATQFAVMSTGNSNISILNGNNINSDYCGSLNGVEIPNTTITLQSGDGEYYIYIVKDSVYALTHSFHSDLVPTLLIARVIVDDGEVKVQQHYYGSSPTVQVASSIHSAFDLTPTFNYADHVFSAVYSVTAKVLCNNLKIEMPSTELPEGSDVRLVAYVEQLNVPYGTQPVAGYAFVSAGDTLPGEWQQLLLNYRLTRSAGENEFTILGSIDNPYLFTFTKLPLNSGE